VKKSAQVPQGLKRCQKTKAFSQRCQRRAAQERVFQHTGDPA
jgi:hypothetical protein